MDGSLLIFLIVFLIICAMLGSLVGWSIYNGITPMPTSNKAKKVLFSSLPKEISGKVYDLGSGWGTLIFPLADRFPESQIIGYESSTIPYWSSLLRLRLFPHPNIKIYQDDFFKVNLEDAGLIVCYLYPGAMQTLKVKLEKELREGTWVISNTFAIYGWQPVEIQVIRDIYDTKIYFYKITRPI